MKNYAYIFDAYGTLLDIRTASQKHSGLLGENTAKVSDLWRKKQLEYTWLRSLMGVHVEFLGDYEGCLVLRVGIFRD